MTGRHTTELATVFIITNSWVDDAQIGCSNLEHLFSDLEYEVMSTVLYYDPCPEEFTRTTHSVP